MTDTNTDTTSTDTSHSEQPTAGSSASHADDRSDGSQPAVHADGGRPEDTDQRIDQDEPPPSSSGTLGIYSVSEADLSRPPDERTYTRLGLYDFDAEEWYETTDAWAAERTPVNPSLQSFEEVYAGLHVQVMPPEAVPGDVVINDGDPLEVGLDRRDQLGPSPRDPDYEPEEWVSTDPATTVTGLSATNPRLVWTDGTPETLDVDIPTATDQFSDPILKTLIQAGLDTVEYPDEVDLQNSPWTDVNTDALSSTLEAIADAYSDDTAVLDALTDHLPVSPTTPWAPDTDTDTDTATHEHRDRDTTADDESFARTAVVALAEDLLGNSDDVQRSDYDHVDGGEELRAVVIVGSLVDLSALVDVEGDLAPDLDTGR